MSEISPIRPSGCSLASCACVSTGCIGVLMTPGATAFTLMPRFAYSIASDLVAALKPPFVSEASTDGTWEFACSIRLGILSERLGDEYASVVDERIDAPEPRQALGNRTLGRLPVGNVAGHHQDLVIVGRPDRPCRRDHPVIAMAICFDKGCAHALRGASDDGNLPVAAHARLLYAFRSRMCRCSGIKLDISIRTQQLAKMPFSYPSVL